MISPNAFNRASAAGSTTNSFAGAGTTENSNDFSGTITAVVTGVLPNGHLLIAGEKQIGVNHNVDVLRFSGQVDPRMIQPRQRRRLGADRQRAHRAARPRRPGRGAGNWLAEPLLFERSADLRFSRIGNRSGLFHVPIELPRRFGALKPLKNRKHTLVPIAMTPTDRFLRASLVLAAFLASAALWWPAPAHAARIKEVASVQGVRTNQLVGYGLVVGLDGTGDQTTPAPFATQSLLALLQQMGVTVPPGTNMQLKNLATVMVTAQLPAFAQPGQTIDVNVSSLANAKSLRGGTLIATPLKGADGQIYAHGPGQPDRRRRGRLGGRLEGADQPPERRPDSRGRDRRARGRHADEPGRLDPARPQQQRLRDRARGGAGDQRPHGQRHRRRARRPRDPRAHAGVGRRPGRASWPRSRTSTSSRRRRRPRS